MKLTKISLTPPLVAISVALFAALSSFGGTADFAKYIDFAIDKDGLADAPIVVPVRLSAGSPARFDYADIKTVDGSDILVTDPAGETVYPCEVDTWDAAGESIVWVRLPSGLKGTAFRLWYGNPSGSPDNVPTATWEGYSGVWHLGEASGVCANSTSVGTALDATPAGAAASASAAVADGVIGAARKTAKGTAAADKAYLSVPSYDGLALGDTFTVSGWVRMTGVSGCPRIFSRKSSYSSNNGWEIEFASGKYNSCSARGASSTSVAATFTSTQDNWVHFTFVYSGKTLSVYANGALAKSGSIAAATDNGLSLSFGSNSSGSEPAVAGDFDEVRLSGGAMDAAAVAAEYAAMTTADLLAAGEARYNVIPADALQIVGVPGDYGTPDPDYGLTDGLAAGSVTCTAPEGYVTVAGGKTRAIVTGWTHETLPDGKTVTVSEKGEGTTCAFTHAAGNAERVLWNWAVQYDLTITQRAGGTVTGTTGWYDQGATATLTATPAEGTQFAFWLGDVPEELRESNPLTLPMDRARTVSALFRDPKVHYVDYVNGTDSGDGTVMPGWKTMKYAIDNAVEGDELVLAKGTHFCKDNLLVDKKLHIHGAGENWETVFDAEHKLVTNKGSNLKITADGVLVNNITFYRLCCGTYDCNMVVVSGDSVISNCVFTGCGFFPDGGDNRLLIDMQKGELNSCWVTNNVYRYMPIVLLEGVNAVKCDNCVIAENRIVTQNNNGGNGILTVRTGQTIVRNCTVANNCVYANTGSTRQHGLSISAAASLTAGPKIYNTIVWGNTNTAGVVRNVYSSLGATYAINLIANDTSETVDMAGNEFLLNTTNTIGYGKYVVGAENVTYDPALDACYGLVAGTPDAVKFGAKLDADADGVDYCTGSDIYGVPRGNKPSLGAYQYVESTVLAVKVVPSAETARIPETITLSAVVEGAASQTVTCAWDLDGDGEFDDGMGMSIVLDQVGEYPAVSVKVSDGVSTAANTYPGTLTVLEELLDVTIVANGKIVRQPSALVFSAQIANAYVEPLTYSWDTDGDGVGDWTGATVEYANAGIYRAPTLLSIVDANGKHQENVTQEGTFNHHPEGAATYYVDYAKGSDGSAGSAASPWKTLVYAFDIADDGDEIVLKRGTHTVSSIVTLAKALHVRGEGAKEDTILDANYGSYPEGESPFYRFVVSAAGASVSDLTFTRFGCAANDSKPGFVCLYADAVISNVVVTSCGFNTVWSGHIVDMTAGLFTHCWVTNNIAGDCAGVQMTGPCVMENCAILGNSSVDGAHTKGAVVDLLQGTGDSVVRNCTISGNTFAATNGAAIYGYLTDSKKGAAHLYDNIVWDNSCTKVGEIHPNAYNGASQQKWFVKNNCWDYDDATRLKDPEGGTNFCNVNADPQFDLAHGGAPRLQLTSPCRNKGDKALGSTASVDLLGNPRIKGGRIDIGCVEEPLGLGLGILVR